MGKNKSEEQMLENLKLFKKKYIKEKEFLSILELDREYVLMNNSEKENKTGSYLLREFLNSKALKNMLMFTSLCVSMIFFIGVLGDRFFILHNEQGLSNVGVVFGQIFLIFSAIYVPKTFCDSLFKKWFPRFLEKDNTRRINSVLSNKKTRKYWQDYFVDDKIFKASLNSNTLYILTVLKMLIDKYENEPNVKSQINSLIESILEKGFIKEVMAKLVDFLVIPKNNRNFEDTINHFMFLSQNERVRKCNEMKHLMDCGINQSIDAQVAELMDQVNENEEIVFFKNNNQTKAATH